MVVMESTLYPDWLPVSFLHYKYRKKISIKKIKFIVIY